MRIPVVIALAAFAASAALAQSEARRDPADPKVRVPAPEYRSVFEDYRPYADPELIPWRKTNDEVGEAGGHKSHGPGQSSEKTPAKPSAGSPQKSPAAQDHGGHK